MCFAVSESCRLYWYSKIGAYRLTIHNGRYPAYQMLHAFVEKHWKVFIIVDFILIALYASAAATLLTMHFSPAAGWAMVGIGSFILVTPIILRMISHRCESYSKQITLRKNRYGIQSNRPSAYEN